MATYLKRAAAAAAGAAAGGAKSSGAGLGPPSLICPVCRGVLREPVRLPCAHTLCLGCLQKTVQHATLSCPLCRLRLGSWLRASANANHSLVDPDLDRLVRDAFPQRADPHKHDHDLPPKRILSAAGEIRKEYEAQLQLAEEEMRRQRENERLASEALIRKIQEEEEQQKLVQLAQDQLLAKTLAKSEVLGKPSEKLVRNSRLNNLNLDKTKTDATQSKSSQKMSVKSKGSTDTKKTNVALISKIRSERYASNIKSSGSSVQKESSETFSSQKPVPIHNAVTRVVTHQNRASHSKNSTISAALGEIIGSTSKIYGLQCKEELQVPSDVISSKKKKLGVEVVTTVEGEERIGSAESAGSHDSINQEIHHFKPIRACSRTPLRVLDGKQIDPKLIRVLPILKRISNAVPKPPTPTHLKKTFGCSWSAFKRISRQQLVLHKDSSSSNQQETKKTDSKKSESLRGTGKLAKTVQDIYDRDSDTLAFDTNKNYTKNVNKIINGTKVSKKLNLDNQMEGTSNNAKQNKRRKVKNGLLPNKHKKEIAKKAIEIVEIEDDEPAQSQTAMTTTIVPTVMMAMVAPTTKTQTPDPLAFTPKNDAARSQSPEMDYIIENIAERIKRRNNTKTTSNTENVLSAINMVVPTQQVIKAKSKKPSSKVSKTQQKTKKQMVSTKPLKKKVPVVTSVTSHIKKLAARSMKRPRYTEDSESEPEPEPEHKPEPEPEPEPKLKPEPEPEPKLKTDEEKPSRRLSASAEQRELEANELAELDRSVSDMITPSLPKKPRKATKTSKSKKKQAQPKKSKAVASQNHVANEEELDEASIIKEQERLERLAAQEREDREIALQLQARFAAMERVANRTRRGQATRVPSPQILNEIIQEKRPQKRTAPVN